MPQAPLNEKKKKKQEELYYCTYRTCHYFLVLLLPDRTRPAGDEKSIRRYHRLWRVGVHVSVRRASCLVGAARRSQHHHGDARLAFLALHKSAHQEQCNMAHCDMVMQYDVKYGSEYIGDRSARTTRYPLNILGAACGLYDTANSY